MIVCSFVNLIIGWDEGVGNGSFLAGDTMDPKELIKADSATFWRWTKQYPITHPRPVYIASEKSKLGRKGRGKNVKAQ